jgi:hypothetical protein
MCDCILFTTDREGDLLAGVITGKCGRVAVHVQVLVSVLNVNTDPRTASVPEVVLHAYDRRVVSPEHIIRHVCIFHRQVFLDCRADHGPGTADVWMVDKMMSHRGGPLTLVPNTEFMFGRQSFICSLCFFLI